MSDLENDSVAQPSSSYEEQAEKWELPEALMGGTDAMRNAGREYLPQEPGESNAAYENRLARTTLFNAFRKTIKGHSGRVYSREPVVNDDTPDDIAGWMDNVDNAGTPLTVFGRSLFDLGLTHGRAHILVDYPQVDESATLADERANGVRPYWVMISALDLIGWRWTLEGGKPVLTQIRFKLEVTEDDGDFGEVTVNKIRVINRNVVVDERTQQVGALVTFQTWREDPETGEWSIEDEGTMRGMTIIPLVTFYTRQTGYMTSEPPFEDLAELNKTHWQSSSDQRHILHVARVPILFGKDLPQDEEGKVSIEIGPNRLITGTGPDADLKFVEHTGAAIEAGANDLSVLEEQMQLLGLEPLMRRAPGDQTATGRAIDAAEAHSELQMMAIMQQQAFGQAMLLMARWTDPNAETGGSVKVNTDFGLSADEAAALNALTAGRGRGDLSRQTWWEELQRRNILSEDFDAEREEGRLETEPDPMGGLSPGDDFGAGGGGV